MNAKLPESLFGIGIKDMIAGEEAWTVPWAMHADERGDLWLHGGYSWVAKSDGPMGTANMLIKRVRGGFEVDVRHCRDHGWTPGGSSYIGGVKDALPVVKLSGARRG